MGRALPSLSMNVISQPTRAHQINYSGTLRATTRLFSHTSKYCGSIELSESVTHLGNAAEHSGVPSHVANKK